jgi:hypothetical protein
LGKQPAQFIADSGGGSGNHHIWAVPPLIHTLLT